MGAAPMTSLAARRVLLAVAFVAAGWGVAVVVTGGFVVDTLWGRLSSRDATRPLAAALVCGITYFLAFREAWRRDAGPLARLPRPSPRILALGLSAVALIVGLRFGTFVAGGPDESGYVSQAQRWTEGTLVVPVPGWVRSAPWPDAEWTATPLGYHPGAEAGTQVPSYPPGLPLLMAAAQIAGGPDAVYWIGPVCGGLVVWLTFLLGSSLGGAWIGVAAALLMLASPGFLFTLVRPIGDVPATAAWAAALLAALSASPRAAIAAGIAATVAVAIRPNLAPLVAVIAAMIAIHPVARWRRLLLFAAALAPGVVLIAVVNLTWYGSPVQTGYGSLDGLYGLDRIWPNLRFYLGLLLAMQTPLLLLALAAPAVAPSPPGRLLAAIGFVAFPLAVLGQYLPYIVFDDWPFIRFLLPGFPPLLAASAAALAALAARWWRPPIALAVTIALVGGVALWEHRYSSAPFGLREAERRYLTTAEHARSLPANAVFITQLHSGSLRHYAGSDILRSDTLDPAYLDTAVGYLAAQGLPVYVISDPNERPQVMERFAGSRTVAVLQGQTPRVVDGVAIYEVPPAGRDQASGAGSADSPIRN